MTPRVIAIEGAHGAGKDVLALGLAEVLDTPCYGYRRHDGAGPWEAALSYAMQRAWMMREASAAGLSLAVASRWHWSTRVLASALDTLGRGDEARALAALHGAERRAIGDPLLTIVCDAPEDVLRARVGARGETWGPREAAERAEILRLARLRSWPVLDTTRDRDVVLGEALGIVREVLRGT